MKKITSFFLCAALLLTLALSGGPVVSAQTATVTSVTAETLVCYENIDGETEYVYDAMGRMQGEYFSYNIEPSSVTVTFSDGSVFYGSIWEFQERYSLEVSYSSDQGLANKWGKGLHTATIEIGSVTGDYSVSVTAVPIRSVKATPVKLYVNTNGTWEVYEDPGEPGSATRCYFYHLDPELEITFDDGSVKKARASNGVSIGDNYWHWCGVESDQSFDNPWDIGLHTATVDVMGVTATVAVEILSSPIRSLSVEPITCIENADGFESLEFSYDPATGGWNTTEWYRYEYAFDETADYTATVELKDGRTVHSTERMTFSEGIYMSGFLIDGVPFYLTFEDEQSSQEPWGLGVHSVTAYCSDVSCPCTVEVVASPVQQVQVAPITLIEGINDEPVETLDFSVTLNDGTVVESDLHKLVLGKKGYSPVLDWNSEDWTAGHTYTVNGTLCGKDFTFDVNLVENPYKNLTISGTNELVLSFETGTGETQTMTALDFYARAGGDASMIGDLITDGCTFTGVRLDYDETDGLTKRLTVTIGDMVSNTLDGNLWLPFNDRALGYAMTALAYRQHCANKNGTPFDGYPATPGQAQLDAILTLAVNLCTDYYDADTVEIDGYTYVIMDLPTVEKNIAEVFGLTGLDLTEASGYQDASPAVIYVDNFPWGTDQCEKTTFYQNGAWHLIYDPGPLMPDRKVVRITMNDAFEIRSIRFTDPAVGDEPVYGDANGDNTVDTTDLLLLKQYLAGLVDARTCSDGLDANNDGMVDTADLLVVKQYLAGLIDRLGD